MRTTAGSEDVNPEDSTRIAYLQAMGIPVWLRRDAESASLEDPVAGVGEGWEALRTEVAACTACGLHASRTQTVFGVGSTRAHWLVIGEAPGADEDAQGEPFVGRAGQLLNSMLLAAGFQRDEVYIANILKCRPPKNRDPSPEESAHCMPFLQRQVSLLTPRVILAVGRVAAQNLLGTSEAIGRMRGRVHRLPEVGTPVVVTYHPAYLLRSPLEKRKAWQDLKLALSISEGASDHPPQAPA